MSVKPRGRSLCGVSVLAALVAGLAGCSSDKNAAQIAAMNDTNLKKVTNLYTAYMSRHGWTGPKDEGELKAFIRDYDPEKVKAMRVDTGNIDAMFTSERDNKPFKVRYGLGGGPTAAVAITFEQDGVNGRRQVGFSNGTVEEVDESRYTQLWTGKAGAASASAGPPSGGPPVKGGPGGPTGAPPGAPTGPPK